MANNSLNSNTKRKKKGTGTIIKKLMAPILEKFVLLDMRHSITLVNQNEKFRKSSMNLSYD